MADMNRILDFLEGTKTDFALLKNCNTMMVCPTGMRNGITSLINREMQQARQKKFASVTLKVNSLSDHALIEKLNGAASAGLGKTLTSQDVFP